MDDQIGGMFEAFKQELTDINKTNDDAISFLTDAWRGEASTEYINTLRMLGEYVTTILLQTEQLREKVSVFVGSLSNTDAPII